MRPSDFVRLREAVQRDEGLRLKAYVDTAGKITVGYGRNLTDVGITLGEANILLQTDLETAVAQLTQTFPVVLDLDPVRQIVLANLCFNMGIGTLAGFRQMWLAIAKRDFETAAAEMLNSTWATQVGARATRLAEEMRRGELLTPPLKMPLWTKGPHP